MNTQQLILAHLPEDLHELAQQYLIPDAFIEKMPDLITLVLRSRSLDKEDEKQSWFNLLPVMNDEQIQKLRDILTRERDKLKEIEEKYEQKKMDIKKKYLMRRQNMWYIKKMNAIQEKEAVHREQEQEEADALLEWL